MFVQQLQHSGGPRSKVTFMNLLDSLEPVRSSSGFPTQELLVEGRPSATSHLQRLQLERLPRAAGLQTLERTVDHGPLLWTEPGYPLLHHHAVAITHDALHDGQPDNIHVRTNISAWAEKRFSRPPWRETVSVW